MTEEREQIDDNTIGRSFVIGNKLSQTSLPVEYLPQAAVYGSDRLMSADGNPRKREDC